MRIVSCHIENFGVLSNKNFDFDNSLSLIEGENGFGKSTLTYFIKAMFYGLEGDGKRDDIQNERRRFMPWQGGAFGGSLTFTVGEKTYTVTRFFGTKAVEDTFELRDSQTNMVSKDFSEKLGEEIFSINSESFIKTVFIKQSDCYNTAATDDINAKLGNISDGIDLNKFAAADECLKDALNAFSATRKTGEIARLKARQSELKALVNQGNGIEAVMGDIEVRIENSKTEIESLKTELSKLNEKKKQAAKKEKQLSEKKTYDNLLKEIEEREHALNERRAFFSGKAPSKALCEEWEEAVNKMNQAESVVKSTQLSEAEAEIYRSLTESFREGVPSIEELDLLIEEASRANRMTMEAKRFELSQDEEEKLNGFFELYDDPNEVLEEINEATELWNGRKNKLYKLELLESKLAEASENRKSGGFGYLIWPALSLCILVVLLFLNNIPTATKLAFGSVLAVAALSAIIIGSIRRKNTGDSKETENLLEEIDEIKEDCQATTERVSELIESFELEYNEESAYLSLQNMLADTLEIISLCKKQEKYNELIDQDKLEKSLQKIQGYLLSHGVKPSSDYIYELTELKGKLNHYKSLSLKNANYKEAIGKARELKEGLREELLRYEIEPGIDIGKKVSDVHDIVTELESLETLWRDSKNRLSVFSEDVNVMELINADSKGNEESFDEIIQIEKELNDRLEALRNNILTDSRTYDSYEARYEEWRELSDELRNLDSLIIEKTHRLGLIAKTEELLTQAKEKLTARYMEPILNGFRKYYTALTGNEGREYLIDANTVITKEEKGKQRSIDSLSYGYKDLVGLCMRLAMADAMYEKEKPMLVLDDPFVNLDDKKLSGAKKLLDEVSKEYQIIYLTCRKEREF